MPVCVLLSPTPWSGNLISQIVCYTEASGQLSLVTVRKRASAFKKNLAGDQTSHLSITVRHGLSLTNQLNEQYNITVEHNQQSQLLIQAAKAISRRVRTSFPSRKDVSSLLSVKKYFPALLQHLCYPLYGSDLCSFRRMHRWPSHLNHACSCQEFLIGR